jgi:hypothetical protein
MPHTDPWRKLRNRRRWWLGLILGWIPFVLLVVRLQSTFLRPPLGIVVVLGYMATSLAIGLRFNATPCPRCGRQFVSIFGSTLNSPWSQRCESCKVKIGDSLGA